MNQNYVICFPLNHWAQLWVLSVNMAIPASQSDLSLFSSIFFSKMIESDVIDSRWWKCGFLKLLICTWNSRCLGDDISSPLSCSYLQQYCLNFGSVLQPKHLSIHLQYWPIMGQLLDSCRKSFILIIIIMTRYCFLAAYVLPITASRLSLILGVVDTKHTISLSEVPLSDPFWAQGSIWTSLFEWPWTRNLSCIWGQVDPQVKSESMLRDKTTTDAMVCSKLQSSTLNAEDLKNLREWLCWHWEIFIMFVSPVCDSYRFYGNWRW